MSGPLAGIRVFDFTLAAVGPWGAKLLADLGADVIKVEAPGGGDIIRLVPPNQKGMGVVYIHCNFNKRGIILDLKQEKDREAAYALVKTCDVFLENMRPGVADRLGLSYEVVSQVRPDIIYLSACAYGRTGPLSQDGGADPTVQAFAGWSSINGQPGGQPEVFRYYAHIDLSTSAYLSSAIIQALLVREQTGKGQKIEITMSTVNLALQATRLAEYFAGEKVVPMGSACRTTVPHQAFLCQDQKYIAVGVMKEDQWPGLCAALGLDDLAADPRFATNARRVENRDDLVPILEEVFITKPVSWWVLKLSERRVPNGRFMDFEALRYHPTVLENEYIVEIDTKHWGPISASGLAWGFSKTPLELRRGPAPGEHTEEVLREIGYVAQETAAPKA